MMSHLPSSISVIAFSFFLFAPLVSAFSFVFTNTPQQCGTLSVQVTGSGAPPYSVLIVPFGSSPLPNGIEVRTIISQQFSGNGASVSFPLNYPEGSQFVAVVSDNSGFGTGGTSGVMSVASSSTSSCFDASQSVHPAFFYNLSPDSLAECNASLVWWDPTTVQGNVNFQGVIPGGESFSIPVGTLTNVPGQPSNTATGFDWTPSIVAGTTVLLVAGDQRGLGSGGSAQLEVSSGPNSLCITNNSPSSTAGPPAGSIVTSSIVNGGTATSSFTPTPTIGGGGGSSNGANGTTTGGGSNGISSKELGAIVGGATGGFVALVGLAVLIYFIRRNPRTKPDGEQAVDLIVDDTDGESPQNRHPLPFPDQRQETYHVSSPTASSYSQSQAPSMSQYIQEADARYSVAGSVAMSDAITGSPTHGTASLSNRQSGMTSFSDRTSAVSDAGFGLGLGLSMLPEEPAITESSLNVPGKPPITILRPVNVIQHEDAGLPTSASKTQTETIELPPAYSNIH